MALWDKLRTELDRAGRVAQTAFDEGKTRLELARLRQLSDRAAEALGYAVFNARRDGGELDAESYARLSDALGVHQAEIRRLEEELERAGGPATGEGGPGSGAGGGGTSPEGDPPAGSPTGGPTTGAPDPAPAAEQPPGQPLPGQER